MLEWVRHFVDRYYRQHFEPKVTSGDWSNDCNKSWSYNRYFQLHEKKTNLVNEMEDQTFKTIEMLYAWLLKLFRLPYTPRTFKTLMIQVLAPFLNLLDNVYFNEIFILSNSTNEPLTSFEKGVLTMREEKLYVYLWLHICMVTGYPRWSFRNLCHQTLSYT